MTHFETEQWVHAPLSLVFRFFCDPTNLPVLSPPQAGAALLKVSLYPPIGAPTADDLRLAGVGSEVLISVRILPLLPIRATWLARITELVWEQHFTDIQVRGPFHQWTHRHAFQTEVRHGCSGTVVRDVVDYEAPLGALGRIADRLFLHQQIEAMFAHRQKALADIFQK